MIRSGSSRSVSSAMWSRNPWIYVTAGLALASVGWGWFAVFGEAGGGVRGILVFCGMLAALAATAIRTGSWKVWAGASAVGLVSRQAINADWDSARLFVLVLAIVGAFIALLTALPGKLRRLAISVVILIHFGGIATAAMTVPPTPWLATVVWSYFYRYYLEFMYLSNAYHFYAPEPGPATLLWAYVKYDDGSGRWFEMPRREDHALAVEYQRRLSFTESINQLTNRDPRKLKDLSYGRLMAAQTRGIPLHPRLPEVVQYSEPALYSKHMLETYSRYLAGHMPHPTNPQGKVVGVKMFRVMHCILNPDELASGRPPDDPTGYLAYYQGEFTPDGELKDPADPLLYWLIPTFKKADDENQIVDYVKVHAKQN